MSAREVGAATGTPKRPDKPRLAYGVPEAATALGIGKTKMWEMVGAGEIEVVKLGGRTLIKAEVLKALLDHHTSRAA